MVSDALVGAAVFVSVSLPALYASSLFRTAGSDLPVLQVRALWAELVEALAAIPDGWIAAVVFVMVSLSFPCFLYGAYYIIETEPVTWSVLLHHLKFVVTGLTLTTVPMLVWMAPRLPNQLGGLSAVHAYLGLQAYALLLFGGTGIVRIFRAKRRHDLYNDYDEELLIDEIGGEQMDHWRSRLRIGVFGYVIFWMLAYAVGAVRFVIRYVL